jgi:predicted acylesterase/phospholipase RssA
MSGEPVWLPPENAKVVGLALSGGGIRSSAFCLGVLQALHVTRVVDRVDYLSTVSGGGYVGCSLTAALEWTGRTGNAPDFPFASRSLEPALGEGQVKLFTERHNRDGKTSDRLSHSLL